MTKIKVAHAHLFVNMNQQIATNIFLFGKYPVYNAIRIAYCAIRIELNFLCGSYIIWGEDNGGERFRSEVQKT